MRTSVLLIFFTSGVAGLAYEVSWTRQIGLLFGQTVAAAAVVLSCYFAGMAVGYVLAGRFARRVEPLWGYAIAETIVGLWALVIPIALDAASRPWVSSFLSGGDPWQQTLLRAASSFALLLPATVALGASLPFMAEHLARHESKSRPVAIAYALNVAGAFVGVVLATLVLITSVGVRGTSYVAAALSLGCAVSAVWLSRHLERDSPGEPTKATFRVSWHSRWTWIAILSGFGALALQVLYMRLFSLVLHNSVYSFGTVVAVFLIAMAAGSWFVSRYAGRLDSEKGLFVACQTCGIAVVAFVLLFLAITKLEYFHAGSGFAGYLAGVSGLSLLVMAVPVGIAGLLLPWAWHGAAASGQSAQVVGGLAAVNSLAAATGSAAASFVLLPAFGLWGSFIAVGCIYVASALLLFPRQRTKSNLLWSLLALGFFLLAYVAANRSDGTEEGEEVVKRWESAYGWIDVVKFAKTDNLQLRQNIHYGLGSTASVTMQRRQSLIPLLLHPNPRSVLLIGLATGTTAGGALDYRQVESVDVVELIPDVVKGAALFEKFNRGVVNAPRATITINDGRHFLQSTNKRYDVIVGDLFVPWESHTGYLYTTEHFRRVRESLAPQGVFCQWIPLWQLGEREFRLIADTFASVFPRTTLWFGKIHEHWTAVGLVGSEANVSIDATRVASILANPPPALPSDNSWFSSPADLLAQYAGDWPPPNSNAALNTDEWPRVEFYTPVTAWTENSRLRFGTLELFQKEVLAKLPQEFVRYLPMEGEIAPDPERVRMHQLEAMSISSED